MCSSKLFLGPAATRILDVALESATGSQPGAGGHVQLPSRPARRGCPGSPATHPYPAFGLQDRVGGDTEGLQTGKIPLCDIKLVITMCEEKEKFHICKCLFVIFIKYNNHSSNFWPINAQNTVPQAVTLNTPTHGYIA